MFDYGLTHCLSFAGTVVSILLTPGPELANTATRTLSSAIRGA